MKAAPPGLTARGLASERNPNMTTDDTKTITLAWIHAPAITDED